ncbi:MAG: antitoxin VapB family protein [Methanocellales archaeon]|nr:antitoxin VapB family protein [Methanocellales archaeon]
MAIKVSYNMVTTIQIKEDVKTALDGMKMFERETYNDVLERLLEDTRESWMRRQKKIFKRQ